MAQQDFRYEGTTYLLIGVQALGWLSMAGGIVMFFRAAYDPLAIPLGISGVVGGLSMVAMGSVGRIIVDVAETYLVNVEPQFANQLLQLKATEALEGIFKDRP
jgi:hypothetical protein